MTASSNRIRFQHSSVLVCDVNAVMEHYAALIFGGFTEGDADAPDSMRLRSFQVRQFQTLVVEDVEIVMKVEGEPRHHLPRCLQ